MNSKRILLVEDEESVRITLAANLELVGYVVVEAETAERALELLGEHDVDLVLSDVKMPGMSGVELQRRVRAVRPDLPVVLMTAYTDESILEQAVFGGVFTILSKPFVVDEATALLDRAMRRPLVIVVDDPETEAQVIVAAMLEAGVRAVCATSNAEAVRAVRHGKVDVCIVALELGESDGTEVLRSVRAVDRSVVLIALSGSPTAAAFATAAGYGVHRFLEKPVDVRRVISAVVSGRAAPLSYGSA